jgi:hypothetical protein
MVLIYGLLNKQVVNQGIDTKKYDPTQTFKDMKELGLQNKIIVGFLVRMTAQKTPLLLKPLEE